MHDTSTIDEVAWVLLVTEGTVISYPPEIYRSHRRAALEAERWAWLLSGEGILDVARPFEGRWIVADRDVRLIRAAADDVGESPWVGTYWTRHGYPDPEALILHGERDARTWVREPPAGGLDPPLIFGAPWFTAAVYVVRGEEEYAVAHLAKVVA
jgi:hypothetical protein